MSSLFELVLPSGRFAKIRKVKFGDVMLSMPSDNLWSVRLLARIVTLDDKPVTVDEILEMDAEEITPIMDKLGSILKSFNYKGIA